MPSNQHPTLPAPGDKSFFGHPRGLATLFFTEMWERLSYYGMRALLLLYMVKEINEGGMGLDDKTGTAIYGLYTMLVYLLALPGGWLADNLLGLRKAVFYGGFLITAGHFSLAFDTPESFFIGLLLIVLGTGLLKPNVSSLVGQLYDMNDQARRDAGFSIFYMGINIGGLLGPLTAGIIGEKINWHYGFATAGVGMALGVIQYKLTEKTLGAVGALPNINPDPAMQAKKESTIRKGLWVLTGLLVLFVAALIKGYLKIDVVLIAHTALYALAGCAILYFSYIFIFEKLDRSQRQKIGVIAVFFTTSCIFYGGLEQQGSTLNLFAERYTDMNIFGYRLATTSMQSVPTFAAVLLAPLFAWLWVVLARRKMNPSTPVKISLGMIFMALGFVVMMGASLRVVSGHFPLPTWLIATYFIHTTGEIFLYVVGLSAVTKLSPQHLMGQLMGVWFMSLAIGNLAAGLFAGEFDRNLIEANPYLLVTLFGKVVVWMGIAGVTLLLLAKPLRRWMGNIL